MHSHPETLHEVAGAAAAAQGGEREIVLGVDDELINKAETEGTSRSIPRADVAGLAVAALTAESASNRCQCLAACLFVRRV